MSSTITPQLYGLVEKLTQQGFRVTLFPAGMVGEPIDYEVSVEVDGLTPKQLSQLLSIAASDDSPYSGVVRNGWLVLTTRY
jgi:hypothetical protein